MHTLCIHTKEILNNCMRQLIKIIMWRILQAGLKRISPVFFSTQDALSHAYEHKYMYACKCCSHTSNYFCAAETT